MRRFAGLFLFCICLASFPGVRLAAAEDNVLSARAADAYGKMPLTFVENRGQLDEQVRYVIRGPRASAFFTNDGVTFDLWDAPCRSASKVSARQHDPLDRVSPHGLFSEEDSQTSGSDVRTHAVLRLTFDGADPGCRVEGMDELSGKVNCLTGKDASKWHTDIPTFEGVAYRDVWPGIDVLYRGDKRQLKYDIRIDPGADLKSIRLKYEGAEKIWLDKAGELHVKTAVTQFVERVPGIYQEKDGEKIPAKGGYVLLDAQTVGFRVDGYDSALPLVIDPASDLVYSTFLGGNVVSGIADSSTDSAAGIFVDDSGSAYVVGSTNSSSFPTTPGAFQTAFHGGYWEWDYGPIPQTLAYSDVFVAKLNRSGSALVYSTFLGGGAADRAIGIAVDSSGCAYVTGYTKSSDFPVTPGSFQQTLAGSADIFVTKLNPLGRGLVYSTLLGGSGFDSPASIAVDSSGHAFLAGSTESSNYKTTTGAFQRTFVGGVDENGDQVSDGFVTELNSTGSGLVYSTFLGGTGVDEINCLTMDSSGCVYVAGCTNAPDFPVTVGSSRTASVGDPKACIPDTCDAFVTKIDPSTSTLGYSTLLSGSCGDCANGIAVDPSGCAYIVGYTYSADFPTTPGAFQTTFLGGVDLLFPGPMWYTGSDGFVTKLNPAGDGLVYSTFLAGGEHDWGSCITVDSSGRARVAGMTMSYDFPVTPDAFFSECHGDVYIDYDSIWEEWFIWPDAFVAELDAPGGGLVYSTMLGAKDAHPMGICMDSRGYTYITGYVGSSDFPITTDALQPAFHGGQYYDAFDTIVFCPDGFLSKFKIGEIINPPFNDSLSPTSGGIAPAAKTTFASVCSDDDGYGDIANCYLLLNTASDVFGHSVYLLYSQADNKLYLMNDTNTAWKGGFAPGSANVIENSQCKLYCAETTVSGEGNQLTVNWRTELKSSMIGKTLVEWMYVIDSGDLACGWDQMGMVTIGNPPSNVSLSPAGGGIPVGVKKALTCQYSDPDGSGDIAYAYLLLNKTTGSVLNSVYAVYNQKVNLIYLRNDTDTGWLGGFAPGSANTIENSQCRIYCGETTVTGSGNNLTVNWKILPKSTMSGQTWREWLMVEDRSGLRDNWDQMGTTTVGNPPVDVSLTPAGGTWTHAVRKQITCQYSDPDGYGDIAYAFILVNKTYGSGANSVYAAYNQKANLLYLRNDANTGWIGGFAPGSAGTMENAECKIFCADTTVSGSGNDLTVNWSILPKSGMIGSGWMEWLMVTDKAGLSDGWDRYGTIIVQ